MGKKRAKTAGRMEELSPELREVFSSLIREEMENTAWKLTSLFLDDVVAKDPPDFQNILKEVRDTEEDILNFLSENQGIFETIIERFRDYDKNDNRISFGRIRKALEIIGSNARNRFSDIPF